MAETTVSGSSPLGLGRLGRLGIEPACRYERSRPGELLHIDVRSWGDRARRRPSGHRLSAITRRGSPTRRDGGGTAGWEAVHVCVDDATASPTSRCSMTRRRRPQSASCVGPSLLPPPRGSRSRAVMTDNGAPYAPRCTRSLPSAWDRHLRTVPTAPRPTARPSASSARCSAAGPTAPSTELGRTHRSAQGWLWRYNFRRPHGSLGRRPPAARLAELNTRSGLTASRASPGIRSAYGASWRDEETASAGGAPRHGAAGAQRVSSCAANRDRQDGPARRARRAGGRDQGPALRRDRGEHELAFAAMHQLVRPCWT